jgi:hypothetical protein
MPKTKPLKVHVIVEMIDGIISNPVVYLDKRDAKAHFDNFIKEHDLDREEPYNDEFEISLFETTVIEPRMVLAAHRRAMARLEAICS